MITHFNMKYIALVMDTNQFISNLFNCGNK